MSFFRLFATVGVMLSVIICTAQESFVFEDFEGVEAWDGFELSDTHARSGKTSALWRNMQRTSRVGSQDIPHDWSDYSAFTFWVYNERQLPNAFMCIVSSENPATEGIDYWAVNVALGFTGYKRFGLLIRPKSGVRSPRGWDQVDSIYFTASGWGNEPNPEAVVYIDRLELRNDMGGPGPLITDGEFFDLLREDIEDLGKTRQAAAQGDYDAADRHLLEYMRSREEPVWSFDWREWDGSRDADFNTGRADRAMAHIFKWQGREGQLAEDIDWTASAFDPSEPAYTPEWTYDLNRFGFWGDLGKAYWATGDEKYAREFISQMLDWVHDQPAPAGESQHRADVADYRTGHPHRRLVDGCVSLFSRLPVNDAPCAQHLPEVFRRTWPHPYAHGPGLSPAWRQLGDYGVQRAGTYRCDVSRIHRGPTLARGSVRAPAGGTGSSSLPGRRAEGAFYNLSAGGEEEFHTRPTPRTAQRRRSAR